MQQYASVVDVVNAELFSVEAFEEIEEGRNFASYRVVSSDGVELFVKGFVSVDDEWVVSRRLQREKDVLVGLNESGVAFIPEVYALVVGDGFGVLVCEFVGGKVFSRDVLGDERMAESVGECLDEIHSVSKDGMPSGEFVEGAEEFSAHVGEEIEGTSYAEYGDVVRRSEGVIAETGSVSGLVHGDFHPPNVLFDSSGEVAYVVDWEYGGVSDVLLDVAKAEVRFFLMHKSAFSACGRDVAVVLEEFRRGYGFAGVDGERLQALEVLFVLRELALIEKYGELAVWERVGDGESAIEACEKVLGRLLPV